MYCITLLVVGLWRLGACSQAEFEQRTARLIRTVSLPDPQMEEVPRLLAQLEAVFNTRWPGCKVIPYGSYVYGLMMVDSDVDAAIMLDLTPDTYARTLEEAKSALEPLPQYTDFYMITWTLVPVMSFKHVPSNFHVDISINAHREFEMSELMKRLLHLDERIYKLAFIVKYWAKLHNISGNRLLTNYGMTCLVIFYLQQKKLLPSIASLQKNVEPVMIDGWNYGFDETGFSIQNTEPSNSIVGEFFEYYNRFDFEKYVVCPYLGYAVEKTVFEGLENIPEEFVLLKESLKNNVSRGLPLDQDITIQDLFIHDNRIVSHQSLAPDASFMTLFNFAAQKYRENNVTFVDDILADYAIKLMHFDNDFEMVEENHLKK